MIDFIFFDDDVFSYVGFHDKKYQEQSNEHMDRMQMLNYPRQQNLFPQVRETSTIFQN